MVLGLAGANPLMGENAQLVRDNKRLTLRLERAEAVIEIQKPGATRNPDGWPGSSGARLCHSCRGPHCIAARPPQSSPPTPARALAYERQDIIDLLWEPDVSAEIYASLLDQGVYHCSIRTMYRILHQHDEIRERRRQLRHPLYQKPELLAEGQTDGPCHLYVIIDIFSRRIVGWCVADTESANLFKPLFQDAVAKHSVSPGQLILHADRGRP